LNLCKRYSTWIKKEKDDLEHLSDFLLSKESELRAHPEFDEVHPDDLRALSTFKESLGIKGFAEMSNADEETTMYDEQTPTAGTPSPMSAASSRRRISTTDSRSRTSFQSNLSNLSPLYEDENDEDHAGSPTPQKRRKLDSSRGGDNSVGSSITKSTYNPGTVVEEKEQESDIADNESD
jgi:hypothetical protein